MSIETLLWTEKYRPRKLADLSMSKENRALVEAALAAGEIPHLLLHGPAGCGKTTLAFIIRDALDCNTLVLNASKERGIDVVRDTIGNFARARMGARWNYVILDEADFMTGEAQTALRNLMETYSDGCRFCFTANYLRKIIDPIQSRCTVLRLDVMEVVDRARALLTVLMAEGVDADPAVVKGYAERYTDLRRMLSDAQKAVLASGGVLTPCTSTTEEDGQTVLSYIAAKDWGAVRKLSQDPATDHAELLRAAFWAVPDNDPRAASMRMTLAQAHRETAMVPDPVVHFLGVMAELIQGS